MQTTSTNVDDGYDQNDEDISVVEKTHHKKPFSVVSAVRKTKNEERNKKEKNKKDETSLTVGNEERKIELI